LNIDGEMTNRADISTMLQAFGDPTRQAIVDRLVGGDATVNELAGLFPISLQAVSKHIKVLEVAGVVSRRREGQTRPVHLEPAAINRTADWLEAHRRRLEARYERLDELLKSTKGST
jgi:DNA-binding transcriptional ArsR family regulator